MAINSFLRSFSLLLLLATAIDALQHHEHHDHDHHNLHSHSHRHNHRHSHYHQSNDNNVKILLPQILSQLGFLDLATAASSLSSSSAADWPAGPSTVFAPSDASIRSYCGVPNGGTTTSSCSLADLLREYVVPGIFSAERLGNLSHSAASKIETLTQGHCVTVTKRTDNQTAAAPSKIFISGVEITRPDLFNNGLIAVHGLRGLIAPLSPFSCDFNHQDHQESDQDPTNHQSLHFSTNPNYPASAAIMRLMLRDAMQRLRATGYGVLALAIRVKYPELVNLDTMTIFAINDISIFAGGLHSYVGNVRFHIVPNAYLTMADLEKLPLGTIMPTLAEGQSLVVTAAGYGGLSPAPMRINYVRIRLPEVMRNFKVVVHSLFLPFPHIRSVAGVAGDDKSRLTAAATTTAADEVDGKCFADLHDGVGGRICVADHRDHVLVPPEKPTVEIEDHHGL